MPDCRICGNALGPDDHEEHAACRAVWHRRYDAKKCTACGSRNAVRGGSWCEVCIARRTTPYLNYPGGG